MEWTYYVANCSIDAVFRFMAVMNRTDAIFIVPQLQEKYLAMNKEPWLIWSKHLIGCLARAVVWWTLRYLGVYEFIVWVIKAMYEDTRTTLLLTLTQWFIGGL